MRGINDVGSEHRHIDAHVARESRRVERTIVRSATALDGQPSAGDKRGVVADEKPVASEADIAAIVSAHRPGEHLAITFEQRGERKSGFVTLVESDTLEVVTYEQAGMTPTAAMLKLRDEWLSSKVK